MPALKLFGMYLEGFRLRFRYQNTITQLCELFQGGMRSGLNPPLRIIADTVREAPNPAAPRIRAPRPRPASAPRIRGIGGFFGAYII